MKSLLFTMLLMVSALSLGADVRFEISGVIKNSPCEATIINNVVDLGIYNANLLPLNGRATDLIKFSVELKQCPTNLNNVQFKFRGDPDESNANLLAVNSGGAKNVGIAIYEDDGKTLIPINENSKGRSITANIANIMNFYASYFSTGAVTGGEANATADLTISYN